MLKEKASWYTSIYPEFNVVRLGGFTKFIVSQNGHYVRKVL